MKILNLQQLSMRHLVDLMSRVVAFSPHMIVIQSVPMWCSKTNICTVCLQHPELR